MSKRLAGGTFRSKEGTTEESASITEIVITEEDTDSESPALALEGTGAAKPIEAAAAPVAAAAAPAPTSPTMTAKKKVVSILPDSPEREKSEPFLFQNDESEDGDDDDDDSAILNMSLIRNLLGPSTSSLIEDANKKYSNSNNEAKQEGTAAAAAKIPRSMVKNVSFSGVESVCSLNDDEKSREELIHKIGKVQAKLTQLEIDKSAERAMRKKKDKSLVKLAKELNKRAADQQQKEKSINKYKNNIADLEAKLAATRSEMDERIAANEKKTIEYNDELDSSHKKYRTTVADHDAKTAALQESHAAATETLRRTAKEAQVECERLRTQIGSARDAVEEKTADYEGMVEQHRVAQADALKKQKEAVAEHDLRIAEMVKKQEEQTDELRRQLLEANLECDKIRTELAGHLMAGASPEEADEIVNRTMRSATRKKANRSLLQKMFPFLQVSGVVLVAFVAIAYQLGLLSMNAMCAPVMPGTTLKDNASAILEAPWWVPTDFKEQAFGSICGDTRPRASLKFSGGRLVVTDTATNKMILDKRSEIAVVHGNVINFFDRKGKIDSLRSPWSS